MNEARQIQTESATVVTTFGREMSLRTASGEVVRARIKGRRIKPVCGDRVRAHPLPNEPQWVITALEKRHNELTRPNQRGQIEVLAANFDFLCVVAAGKPATDWFIVDRYLCAAELIDVAAAIVFNKIDLIDESGSSGRILAEYEQLGYPAVRCSAKTGENMSQLATLLADRTSIIVGQSGVGKSSLINYLIGSNAQKIREVSAGTGEGKHTTVNSSMLDLQGGGAVIDSPGVRDYAPASQTAEQAMVGFREIRDAGQRCRFANCQHAKEPDCAVKQGVESGAISKRRYDSYRRLVVMSEQLSKQRN